MATKKAEILENMLLKVLTQRKKLNQALEQNKYLEEDLLKIKTLVEE